jgi:trans-aconitate methyltransferase
VLEQETALQNIHKSLVSGGKFLLVVAEKNSNDFLSLNEKLSKSEKWKLHLPEFKNPNIYFTKDEYISLLKDAGFSEIESKVIPMDSTFPNKEAFLSWLKPVLGFISKLPNHLQEEYVLEFANNIINATPVDPDGTIHIITNRLQLVAKKL